MLGVGGYAGNSALQDRELDHLLVRASAALDSVAYSNRKIAATVEYARPQLFGASVQPRVRRSLEQLVAATASGQVAVVQAERDRAAATWVLGWHTTRRRARAALVRYLDGRIEYLREVGADVGSLYLSHPELERRLMAARAAFRVAAGVGGAERVDQAFR